MRNNKICNFWRLAVENVSLNGGESFRGPPCIGTVIAAVATAPRRCVIAIFPASASLAPSVARSAPFLSRLTFYGGRFWEEMMASPLLLYLPVSRSRLLARSNRLVH